MSWIRYLLKSINILNILLASSVAAAAYYLAFPSPDQKIQTPLPAAGKAWSPMAESQASRPYPSFAGFIVISDQNLFHPERKIPQVKKEDLANAPINIPKPDLALYGTLIADTLSIAYVEDRKAPASTPGRGKRQTQLKKGDSIGGYTLREIEPKRIVLFKGEEKLVVLLDEKDRKRGGETATPAAATPSPVVQPPPRAPAAAAARPAILPAAAVPPAGSRPTAISPTASSLPPVPSAQGEKPPIQSGAAFMRPGARPYDARRTLIPNR